MLIPIEPTRLGTDDILDMFGLGNFFALRSPGNFEGPAS
jgi:hypothetical protein